MDGWVTPNTAARTVSVRKFGTRMPCFLQVSKTEKMRSTYRLPFFEWVPRLTFLYKNKAPELSFGLVICRFYAIVFRKGPKCVPICQEVFSKDTSTHRVRLGPLVQKFPKFCLDSWQIRFLEGTGLIIDN